MNVELSRKFIIRASIAIAAVILITFMIWKWRAMSAYRIPENSSTTTMTYSPTEAYLSTAGVVGTGQITIKVNDPSTNQVFDTNELVTITGAPTTSGSKKLHLNIVSQAPIAGSLGGSAGAWTARFLIQNPATADGTTTGTTLTTGTAGTGAATTTERAAMLVSFNIAKTYTINTITGNGTTVSVTFTTPHGLTTGQKITVTGGTSPAAGTYAVSDALITVTGPSTITYPGTGTTGTITTKPTVTISTSAEYNTLTDRIRDCYNAFTKQAIADGGTASDATVAQRGACLKQYTLEYIKGKCAIIGRAETSSTAYSNQTTEVNNIRKAYIQFINPAAGDLTGLNLGSYAINKTALGLPGTATDLQVLAKVATKARDADIAAAGRKYISAMCPDFYTISLPDGTGEITRDYSLLTFNSANVTWPNILAWARKAYVFTYNTADTTAAGSGEFSGVYGGVTTTTENKVAIVGAASSDTTYRSQADTVFTSASTTDYVPGITTQQTYGDVARFFGPGSTTTATGYSALPVYA